MREAYRAKNKRLAAKKYNERLKLKSSLANTLAAAVVISALVFPVIRENNLTSIMQGITWVWLSFGFMLHWSGLLITNFLVSEE